MTMIDWLRLVGVSAWICVLLAFAGSIRRVLAGRSAALDPIWSLLGAYGLLSIGYNARWYVAVGSGYFYSALHVFSILLAVASLVFAHSQRRAQR